MCGSRAAGRRRRRRCCWCSWSSSWSWCRGRGAGCCECSWQRGSDDGGGGRGWTAGCCRCGPARVRTVPAGELVRVRAARGTSLDALAGRAEELGACLGLRELRVQRDGDNAATGTRHARAPRPVRHASRARHGRTSTRSDCRCGSRSRSASTSSARPSTVGLPERNVLLGGEPGAGKSAALSLLVATAALDPTAGCGCSTASSSSCRRGRHARNGSPARTSARRSSCCATCAEMEERYRELLAAGRARSRRDDGLPLHLVACDELAFYLTAEDRKQRAAFAELLRDLVARGRAAGVIVCAATQKPAPDVVPVGAARPVRLPAGAALQHAAGVGHDPRPRLGDAGLQRRDDRAGAARRRAACSPRTARRSGCAASISPTTSSRRSPSAASALRADAWLAEEGDAVEAQA